MDSRLHLPLALLEAAPDRETAEIMLVGALHSGATASQLRSAWLAWEANNRHERLRGEAS
jgi:hypothetical protein